MLLSHRTKKTTPWRRLLLRLPLSLLLATLVPNALRAQTPSVAAEVVKVDKSSGRVTLKHGEIKHLEMPPMTMAYKVRDARLLDELAVGDRVRFVAERVEGQYTVTALSKAPQ